MKDNRVLLGFSGGIDSFAAVGLLQAAGYHVTALTLDMRGDSALLEKARLRAGALGIPWRMRSVRERFERESVDIFTDSYFRGCNPGSVHALQQSDQMALPCGRGRRTGDSPHRYGTLFPHYLRRRQTIRHPCGRQPQGPVLLPVGLAAGDPRSGADSDGNGHQTKYRRRTRRPSGEYGRLVFSRDARAATSCEAGIKRKRSGPAPSSTLPDIGSARTTGRPSTPSARKRASTCRRAGRWSLSTRRQTGS